MNLKQMSQIIAALVLLFLGVLLATPLGLLGFCMVSFTDPSERAMGWLLLVGSVAVAAALFWCAILLFQRACDFRRNERPRVRIKNRAQGQQVPPHEPPEPPPDKSNLPGG